MFMPANMRNGSTPPEYIHRVIRLYMFKIMKGILLSMIMVIITREVMHDPIYYNRENSPTRTAQWL